MMKKLQKGILIGILIFSFFSFFFGLYQIGKWYISGKKVKKIEKEINDIVKEGEKKEKEESSLVNPPSDKESDYYYYITFPFLDVNFEELKKKNADTVGFIKVNNTNINYPIVSSGDNSYYLNHAYDKSENQAGWVFLDYRNNLEQLSKNNIIYGHGRLDHTVFGTLKNALNKKWQQNKENHVIRLSTSSYNYLFQIFSIYSIKAESYYITTDFSSDSSFQEFIDTLQARNESILHTDVSIKDKILTLSTCKNNNDIQIVVHAKLIAMENR